MSANERNGRRWPLFFSEYRSADFGNQHESRPKPRTGGPLGVWRGWWIYWVGPLIGTLLAVVACSFLAKRISVAKLYHFDSDPHRVSAADPAKR